MAYEQMSDVREKVQWAQHHIDKVKAAISAFMATKPYTLRVDVDTGSVNSVVHVLKAEAVPPAIRLGCGDAIQNLRSALDYLACALVRANRNTPTAQIEFPILRGPIVTKDDKANFDRKVKGMRQEAIDQILSIHPYQGGDNLLWRLHSLNRIDKHNMLVAVWGNVTALNGLPPIADQWNGNRWVGIPGVPLGLKEGETFSPQLSGSNLDKSTQFFAEIVFNEPEVAEGYPVVLALGQFYRRVMLVCGKFSWALK